MARHRPAEPPDRRYRHLVEQMQEGALTLAPDGDVLYANRRVAELLGLAPERVVGQDLADFVAAHDAPAWRRLLGQAARTGGRGELTLLRTDGVEVPVFASLSARWPTATGAGCSAACSPTSPSTSCACTPPTRPMTACAS